MTTPSRTNLLITRSNLYPLAGDAPATEAQIHPALAAKRRAEREREELACRRAARVQAANEAVDDFLRESGTTNYQAAFMHIQRTRPELFAEMQVPAHQVAAANFNPNHDRLGRFSTSQDAAPPHSGRGLDPGARSLRIDAVAQPQADKKEYQGKISAGAYFQSHATGLCSIAIAREAVTQVETVRTDGNEPLPKGADSSMRALQYAVRKYWEPTGISFDFSEATKGHGAAIQDLLPILSAKFNIHSQPITVDQIPAALKHGPVMVAAHYNASDHGELIIGLDKDREGRIIPGSYRVYNPLNPVAHETTLDGSNIIRDSKHRPELFALRPYQNGENHPADDAHLLPPAKGLKRPHQ